LQKRILVTGCAGFIGSNLCGDLLGRGYDVIGLDNLAYGLRENVPEGVKFVHGDIRDARTTTIYHGVDTVFHLAAKNCISDCQLDPVETADINVKGTVQVFDACRQAHVRKIIYAESSALYEGSRIIPTPESEVKPESFYAASKAATNYFADAYARFYKINFTALRYFCVYGPVQDYRRTIPPVMSAFIIKLLKSEQPVIYGSGDKRRDFVYVDDVNRFHIQCVEDENTDGKVFNIGSGKNYSVRQIYQFIAELLHSNIKPIYKTDLPGEAQETLADITAAKKVGWEPLIDIHSGLLASIEYIRKEVIAKGIVWVCE
jgi:UDP-glucose 4-epimerase